MKTDTILFTPQFFNSQMSAKIERKISPEPLWRIQSDIIQSIIVYSHFIFYMSGKKNVQRGKPEAKPEVKPEAKPEEKPAPKK